MKLMAFNGSPRKKWNTAALLQKAVEGAAAGGAQTELIHLYDYSFQGCISCFSCKLSDGKSYGNCALKDQLTPILARAKKADALILGSPVYLGTESGQMRLFMERLWFPYLVYSDDHPTAFPRKIKTGLIYTMNIAKDQIEPFGLDKHIEISERFMKRIFGSVETLLSTDTCQFEDYAKYHAPRFDAEHKKRRRKEAFPLDCEMAFDLGRRLTGGKSHRHWNSDSDVDPLS
jgi:multimeric flavodoxin WrbA